MILVQASIFFIENLQVEVLYVVSYYFVVIQPLIVRCWRNFDITGISEVVAKSFSRSGPLI